jgi:mono/diheme cytochrome c family protein
VRGPAIFGGVGVAVLALMAGSLAAHDPITTKVGWNREIGPLIEARCVSCHAPDGPAPMSLATYDEARPWARAIREEVLARRMPKWPVVRGYGDFRNDPSLSPFEIALITAWVDGGAPRKVLTSVPVTRPGMVLPLALPSPATGRTADLACHAGDLPPGTLVGLRPELADGGGVEVIVRLADGREEPLIWLRDFAPGFATTYWLRRPLEVTAGSRVHISGAPGGAACRLRFIYGQP